MARRRSQQARRRVHVSTGRRDTQLALILARLGAVDAAIDRGALSAFVGGCAAWKPLAAGRALELVAHSTADRHLLDWNGWHLGADLAELGRFWRALRGPIATAGIRAVRLVGCRTASTAAGIEAMQTIRRALGDVDVEGTDRVIDAGHFTSAGVVPEVLVKVEHARPIAFALPPPTPTGLVPVTFGPSPYRGVPADGTPFVAPVIELPLATLDESLRRWVDLTRAWDLPGLLARPRCLLVFRIDRDTAIVAEVLFGWDFVRIFPPGAPGGRVFAVTDPAALRASVGADPQVRALLDAIDPP